MCFYHWTYEISEECPMRYPIRFLVCACLLSLTMACANQDSQLTQSAVDTDIITNAALSESKPAADDKICTRERVTGSHFSKKICRTRAEYDALQLETQELLDSMRSSPAMAGES
ncbi:MAG: hypothetical protein ACI81O_002121 [Cyclobacteriaceae bacterium]|jgi:hypothetical protein